MRIKDMSPDDRPREKMCQRGAKSLSNAELLAVLLGSGTGGKNVTEIAQELMARAGGRLTLLGEMPLERLTRQKGIGEVRATLIAAALELGRRAFEEVTLLDKHPLSAPENVYRLMLPTLKNLDHEECWVLFLNPANLLTGREQISSGSMEAAGLDCRRILKKAIEKQCDSLILVHNHPSGIPEPSQSDILSTGQLRRSLASVNIRLLDHVIVCEDSFYSFAEERCRKMR